MHMYSHKKQNGGQPTAAGQCAGAGWWLQQILNTLQYLYLFNLPIALPLPPSSFDSR
jgi:hypothetical protein